MGGKSSQGYGRMSMILKRGVAHRKLLSYAPGGHQVVKCAFSPDATRIRAHLAEVDCDLISIHEKSDVQNSEPIVSDLYAGLPCKKEYANESNTGYLPSPSMERNLNRKQP